MRGAAAPAMGALVPRWLLSIGCQAASATEPGAKQEAPDEPFERDMLVRFHMHENFDLLRAIEKLLIHGKLDDAKSLAAAIAEAPDEPGLGAWNAQAVRVREAAAQLSRAVDIAAACRLEAELAGACASCHDAAGARPEFTWPGRTPADDGTVEKRMARHVWATDRMWEGVVGASDESWRAGLAVLAEAPLAGTKTTPERITHARTLQRLAAGALSDQLATSVAGRTRVYGELLTSCASCHAAPPPPTSVASP